VSVEWEARAGRPAAFAAFASALLIIVVPTLYLGLALDESPDGVDELLFAADRESTDFIISGAVQALGLILFIGPLLYLYRAIKHRRPELPSVALILLIAGPALAAIVRILRQIDLVSVAGDFVAMGGGTEDEAEDFVTDQAFGGLGEALFGANLALGLAIVLVSLYAMRTGLLSRFMGILGIIIGVLYLLPPPIGGTGGGIVQLFWLGALGLLFLGRWPGGRGPAWDSGEAIPWPTAAERAEAARARQEEEARRSALPATEPRSGDAEEAERQGATAGGAPAGKRKRKRRR
jgi:hypothetical protein